MKNINCILNSIKPHLIWRETANFVIGRQLSTSSSTNHSRRGRKTVFTEILGSEEQDMSMEEAVSEVNFRSDVDVEGLQQRKNISNQDLDRDAKRAMKMNIRRKHFKIPPEPCLLTYDMKETVRNLHSLDPKRWTPLELSQSFPVSEYGVQRLLKYRIWSKSAEQVLEHDAEVLKNWKKATNGKLGSLNLLKKTVEKRFTEITKSSLPVAVMGSDEEMATFLNGLTFTAEDDLLASEDEEKLNQLKKIRKKYPFKGTFKDIITDYESKVMDVNNLLPEMTAQSETNIPKCQNLSEVLPSNTQHYSENKISVRSNVKNSQSSTLFKSKKMVTFDQFMKRKKRVEKS